VTDGDPPAPHGSDLERGRDAIGRHAWDEAYHALARADAVEALSIDDAERLTTAAGLTGRDAEFLRRLEQTYQARTARGEDVRAGRAAFWMGMRLFSIGEPVRAGGWLARAQRLVAGHDCAEHGYLMIPMIHRHHSAGEHAQAIELAASATALGDRFGEADLSAFARGLQGRSELLHGNVTAGLALLDEAMLAATSGELSPLVTGLIYCTAIATCHALLDVGRMREWTAALSTWCDAQAQLVSFSGICLIHRAELMQLGGAWAEAIDQADRAVARVPESHHSGATADAAYQRGEIHRLRGETVAAEEAYRRASQLGREPQPGLALLRLHQGRSEEAAASIRRVVEGSRADPLRRTKVLPAAVEILLAAGDSDGARTAGEELARIAAAFGTEVLGALAAEARGALALHAGDARRAVEPLRQAFTVWQQSGAPYLAARLRVGIARAWRALGDLDGARLELELAREVFARLGAVPDLARVDELTLTLTPARAPAPPGAAHGLTPRELEVLRLIASGQTNKVIAKQLYLSQKTVDRHVSNIFVKIGVASRAAATAHAFRHRLL
jgi:DNA-binding CsgD family transcriptional regulator